MVKTFGIILTTLLLFNVQAQEPTRWRGPSGDGIYPETGLLKQWPANGPEILWSYENLGQGHSSAAVSRGFIYTSGMIEGKGYLFKFELDGTLVYKKSYGPEYTESWYGTRGTPVIHDGVLYVRHGNAMIAYNVKSYKVKN